MGFRFRTEVVISDKDVVVPQVDVALQLCLLQRPVVAQLAAEPRLSHPDGRRVQVPAEKRTKIAILSQFMLAHDASTIVCTNYQLKCMTYTQLVAVYCTVNAAFSCSLAL